MPRRAAALPSVDSAAQVSAAVPYTPSLSPIVKALRTDWRWASISQFINMFSDAFGLLGFDIGTLEVDLDSTENGVLLDVISKLLYALTWNRGINRDNAFEHLRKQYIRRLPHRNPFGTEEEPIEWYGLSLDIKVQAIHQLCEWQLAQPARFRQLLKSDDEAVTWRIDPIGWDKVGNTYWLFDDNRLWVQHPSPTPPRPKKAPVVKTVKTKKGKAAPAPKSKAPPKKREAPPVEVSRGRKRTKVAPYGNMLPADAADADDEPEAEVPTKGTRQSARRGIAPPVKREAPRPTPTRATRNSRRSDGWQEVPEEWLEPKKAGDDSDSELSELTELESESEPERALSNRASSVLSEPDAELGHTQNGGQGDVEMSAEVYQGADTAAVEDEAKPEELANKENLANNVPVKEDVELAVPMSDEVPAVADEIEQDGHIVSDEKIESLGSQKDAGEAAAVIKPEAELTNGPAAATECANDIKVDTVDGRSEGKGEEGDNKNVASVKAEPAPFVEEEIDENDEVQVAARAARNPGFLEWECICVTLYEWQHVGDRFESSTNRDEKALHRMLTKDVAPAVIEVLQAKENERLKEEAVVNRKRSSRIAVRELEKEEQMKREEAHREAEERMDRARRAERRQAVQEAEVIQKSREARHREREERLKEREEAAVSNAVADSQGLPRPHVVLGDTDSEYDSPAPRAAFRSTVASGTSTPKITLVGTAKSQNNTDRWQLACEICAMTGWNLDNETEIVSCDSCGRWQHVGCHDRADAAAGKPPRDWDRVDFKCRDCIQRARRQEEERQREQHARRMREQEQQRQAQRVHSQPSPAPSPYMIRPPQYSWTDAGPGYGSSAQPPQQMSTQRLPSYPSPAPSHGSNGHLPSPGPYPSYQPSPHQKTYPYANSPQSARPPIPQHYPPQHYVPSPPPLASPQYSQHAPQAQQPWRPQSHAAAHPAPYQSYQPQQVRPHQPYDQRQAQPYGQPVPARPSVQQPMMPRPQGQPAPVQQPRQV